jgi:hypothetical protein
MTNLQKIGVIDINGVCSIYFNSKNDCSSRFTIENNKTKLSATLIVNYVDNVSEWYDFHPNFFTSEQQFSWKVDGEPYTDLIAKGLSDALQSSAPQYFN